MKSAARYGAGGRGHCRLHGSVAHDRRLRLAPLTDQRRHRATAPTFSVDNIPAARLSYAMRRTSVRRCLTIRNGRTLRKLRAGLAVIGIGVLALAGSAARRPSVDSLRLVHSAPASHASSPARSQRNANYEIDARLDVRTHILTGTEVVRWRNITARPTSELRLHLYHNAWESNATSFALANRFAPGSWSAVLASHGPDDWGYCHVTSVTILRGAGVSSAVPALTAFIQPDDGNVADRTVLQVQLPEAVQPGETVVFRVEWEQKEPRPFQRAGVIGDFYLFGQWFPKLGVFEADGSWNCHQFIQTEFYADFGVYDVRLTVPAAWVVGATGHRSPPAANSDGTVTHASTPRTCTTSDGRRRRVSRCMRNASRRRTCHGSISNYCCSRIIAPSGIAISQASGRRFATTAAGSVPSPTSA